VPALVLAPEDLILGICVHLAISKRFGKSLRDLADIAAVITAYRDQIRWDGLVRNAIEWDAAGCLYYCLWASQLITGVVVPLEVLKQLGPELRLSLAKDACLKFLIPRAVFPDSTVLKGWLVNDLIGEILCPQVGISRILIGRLHEYFEFKSANGPVPT
jgi:hypothetical protein